MGSTGKTGSRGRWISERLWLGQGALWENVASVAVRDGLLAGQPGTATDPHQVIPSTVWHLCIP